MKMRVKYKFILLLFTAVIIFSAGCGTQFDRSGYVKGMLDATYKGDCENYAKATHSELKEIEEDHEQFIIHEAQIWLQFCGLNSDMILPQDTLDDIIQMTDDLYAQSVYTVSESNHDGIVTVTIQPINIYNAVYDDFIAFTSDFKERNNNYEFTDYTDDEFVKAYVEPLIEIFKNHMEDLPLGDTVQIDIPVVQNENGQFSISDTDVTALYNAIVSFSIDRQ